MKNNRTNRPLGAWVISAALCSGMVGLANATETETETAVDIYSYSSPFDSCFVNGYDLADVTADQAFETATCFTALLGQSDQSNLGADRPTIMEYSSSWYSAAMEKGHAQAKDKLESNLIALNRLEQPSITDQMLASEQAFQSLDTNADGVLTVAEAASSSQVKAVFKQSDIDNDGSLSYGEYAISAGEATAAGH